MRIVPKTIASRTQRIVMIILGNGKILSKIKIKDIYRKCYFRHGARNDSKLLHR